MADTSSDKREDDNLRRMIAMKPKPHAKSPSAKKKSAKKRKASK